MKPDGTKEVKGHHPATPRVVVVGAGVAGVSAAGTLLAGGLKDVVVLEAADRPGGRVQNLETGAGFVELGAQYLHGQNEVFHIAEQGGMLAEEDSDEGDLPDTVLQFSDFLFCLSDGTRLDTATVVPNLQVLETLQSSSVEVPREGHVQDANLSLGQFYRGRYPSCTPLMQGTRAIKDAMFRWMEIWECQDSGATVDQQSLVGSGQYIYCSGNGTRETTGGMAQVFDKLLHDTVPPAHLHLNKAVKQIHWSQHATPQTQQLSRPPPPSPSSSSDDDVVVSGSSLLEKSHAFTDDDMVVSRSSLLEKSHVFTDKATTPSNPTSQQESMTTDEERNHPQPMDECADQNSNCRQAFFRKDGSNLEKNVEDYGSNLEKSVEDHRVKIECQDGDVFYADHVIVTVSMGVLKEKQELFLPPLPGDLRGAIHSVGFGNVAKAFLFWEPGEDGAPLPHHDGGPLPHPPSCTSPSSTSWQQSMLGSDVGGVIPLWLEDARPQLLSANYKEAIAGRQWYEDVCMFTPVSSQDFCISTWTGGEAATIMESLPESEVKDVLHELLAFFLGRPDLPPPSRLVRTKWNSNPYTRGAYSYLATGMPMEQHTLLSQPLPSEKTPVLQLAGEACSQHYYSTLHGALQSGRQAAQVILRHHNLTLS